MACLYGSVIFSLPAVRAQPVMDTFDLATTLAADEQVRHPGGPFTADSVPGGHSSAEPITHGRARNPSFARSSFRSVLYRPGYNRASRRCARPSATTWSRCF